MLQLTQWKSHVRSKWSQIQIGPIDADFPVQLKVGMQVALRAEVFLGGLAAEDIRVEFYAGRLDAQHEFIDSTYSL